MGRLKNRNKEKPNEADLGTEQAYVIPNSNRSIWSGGLVAGLTPARLGSILNAVRNGDSPADYLELAGELEERDLHYRSVLSTRKHAVEGMPLYVEPVDESDEEMKIAEAVTDDIQKHADILDLTKNSLDALGKGFAVNEILWDTSGERWKPSEFRFRDPRWFAYERETGILKLREAYGSDLILLEPYHYVIHEPNLISGKQITGGLAFSALFYWLIKHYDVTSWAAFVDRFGYPVRVGKYGKKATKDDIVTLKRAVAAIGTDVGAVIPDSMILDIVESKTTSSNAEVYEKLAEWTDKQISKLVLGQTASTEGTAGKLGNEDSQEEVRQDIQKADASQLEQTLNRDLVIPYVKFNFGMRKAYPRLKFRYIEEKNIEQIVNSIKDLVPLGLKVKKTEINSLLGLSVPEDDDEVLEPQVTTPEGGSLSGALNASAGTGKTALNAEAAGEESLSSQTEEELLDEAAESDFIEISDEIAEVLQKAADKATDFKSFQKELEKLAAGWEANKIAELMAVTFFKARAAGDSDFEGEE